MAQLNDDDNKDPQYDGILNTQFGQELVSELFEETVDKNKIVELFEEGINEVYEWYQDEKESMRESYKKVLHDKLEFVRNISQSRHISQELWDRMTDAAVQQCAIFDLSAKIGDLNIDNNIKTGLLFLFYHSKLSL
jgi:hypothetical protein